MAKAKHTSSASRKTSDDMPKIVHHIVDSGLVGSIREDHRITVQRPWQYGDRKGFSNWLRFTDLATLGRILDEYVAWCQAHPLATDESVAQAKPELAQVAA
jgi:hypothetical protein